MPATVNQLEIYDDSIEFFTNRLHLKNFVTKEPYHTFHDVISYCLSICHTSIANCMGAMFQFHECA